MVMAVTKESLKQRLCFHDDAMSAMFDALDGHIL